MGHDKLRKFAENDTFSCLVQASSKDLLANGYANLADHPIKGHWHREKFGSCSPDAPLVLELGCGKGEYTVALAQRRPESVFVGVDIKGARLWKGAKFVETNHISNAAFLRARIEFISAFFAPGEVSEIWLTFSDPQYKSPNSRLSSPVFLDRYRKMLCKGGIVHLTTDSRFLHEYTKSVCKANGLKVLAQTEDLYGELDRLRPLVDSEVYQVSTFYESMFREQGYNINYLSFCIDHEGEFRQPDMPSEFDSDYWRSVEGPRLLFGHDSAETRRRKLLSSQDSEAES